jgi:hypothetical protein
MFKNIKLLSQGGLKCDTDGCDFVDLAIKYKEYKKMINAPCPQCGASLLTAEDYLMVKKLMTSIKIANLIPSPIWKKINKDNSQEQTIRVSFDGSGIPALKVVDEIN